MLQRTERLGRPGVRQVSSTRSCCTGPVALAINLHVTDGCCTCAAGAGTQALHEADLQQLLRPCGSLHRCHQPRAGSRECEQPHIWVGRDLQAAAELHSKAQVWVLELLSGVLCMRHSGRNSHDVIGLI